MVACNVYVHVNRVLNQFVGIIKQEGKKISGGRWREVIECDLVVQVRAEYADVKHVSDTSRYPK